jgi:hypothetical protein
MKGKGIIIDSESLDLNILPITDASGKIKSGLQVGDVLHQNQAMILYMHPGEFKESPLTGMGLADITYDNDILLWKYKLKQQLELDGQAVNEITFNNINQLVIDAAYNS